MSQEKDEYMGIGRFAALLPPLVALAIYMPAAGFGFVNLDDPHYVAFNPHVLGGLTWENIRWAFMPNPHTYWHPLVWLSLMLDAEVRAAPGWFHAVNMFLHAGASMLLYLALARMTRERAAALIVAVLFAVHPLNVEAVAWVTERKTVLAGFFWMLCLYLYALYAEKPVLFRRLAVFAALIAGLMAKPLLVTLPCVLLLLDYWPLARLRISPGIPGLMTVRRVIWEKMPMFMVVAGSCAMTILTNPDEPGAVAAPAPLRAANAVVSYARYVFKAVWPVDTAVFYPFPDSIPRWQVSVVLAAILVVCLTAVAFRRKAPYLIVGWFWFLGAMVPMLGYVSYDRWPAMADRFAYVPMIGLFIIVAFAPLAIVRSKAMLRAVLIVFSVLALVLGLEARHQLSHWRDSEALYRQALSVTKGNWLAENNLGAALYVKGEVDEAVQHYRNALKIRPMYGNAQVNLGLWRLSLDDYPSAEKYLRAGIGTVAEGAAWEGLAELSFKQGRFDEALVRYHNALKHDSRLLASWRGKAECLRRLGLWDLALEAYVKASSLYLDVRDPSSAAELAGAALVLDPSNTHARRLLERARSLLSQNSD